MGFNKRLFYTFKCLNYGKPHYKYRFSITSWPFVTDWKLFGVLNGLFYRVWGAWSYKPSVKVLGILPQALLQLKQYFKIDIFAFEILSLSVLPHQFTHFNSFITIFKS
jgi:hypothetical protein